MLGFSGGRVSASKSSAATAEEEEYREEKGRMEEEEVDSRPGVGLLAVTATAHRLLMLG